MEENQNGSQWKSHQIEYEYMMGGGKKIQIESKFQNGNIRVLRQRNEFYYELEAGADTGTLNSKKTWFHFRVSAPRHYRLKFLIHNLPIYQNMYEDSHWPRPVYRQGQAWQTLTDAYLTYRQEVALIVDFTFNTDGFVYFALSIPFTYTDNEQYLKHCAEKVPRTVAYSDEIIGHSLKELNLHLITVTEKEGQVGKRPIVVITARVHPGEVSSSFCLMGILDFLLRPFNFQAYLLRIMFRFVIVPMVNPDGVFDGNFRMDSQGVNLNRVYDNPSAQMHPTVYYAKQIINSYAKNNRIFAHFDLHSHSSFKNAFFYGNACEDILAQTQSQLFCKIMEKNCQHFRFSPSQFSQKHMRMKDKGQPLTKEGCARVVFSKMANILYSYTLESSIFPYPKSYNLLLPISNIQLSFSHGESTFHYQNPKESHLMWEGMKNQIIIDNMMLGSSLLISLLDILEKNPFTRLTQEEIVKLRKDLSQDLLQKEERFKLLDLKAYQKCKNIAKLAQQQYEEKYNKIWSFLNIDPLFAQFSWPENFKWFQLTLLPQKPKNQRFRAKTETKEQQLEMIVNSKNQKKKINYDPHMVSLFPSHKIPFQIQQKNFKVDFEKKSFHQKIIEEKKKEDKGLRKSLKGISKSVVGKEWKIDEISQNGQYIHLFKRYQIGKIERLRQKQGESILSSNKLKIEPKEAQHHQLGMGFKKIVSKSTKISLKKCKKIIPSQQQLLSTRFQDESNTKKWELANSILHQKNQKSSIHKTSKKHMIKLPDLQPYAKVFTMPDEN